MTQQGAHRLIFAILRFTNLPTCPATETPAPTDPNRYLNAVRTFADNVLKYGKDTYGPKHTPLFVDGLNIHTHEPVKWIDPDGTRWILSNFASQQTLLRTLDGLTAITGDPKYRQAAMVTIGYAFENLRHRNGLFYWGHATAYNATTDNVKYGLRIGGRDTHTLKLHYPYYELMWEVNSEETTKSIEAFWSAHIVNWSNLDMRRYAFFDEALEEPWDHEYKRGPMFIEGGAGAVLYTGTSLIHAGTTLYRLSGEEQPLVWSRRLAKRYVDTRHPKTGISYENYSTRYSQLGDDLKEHFNDPKTTYFPYYSFDLNMPYYYPENVQAYPWMSMLLVGKMLGEEGKELTRWALEEFTAWAKSSYRGKDNCFVPILTDGTKLEGYVWKEAPGTGPDGLVIRPWPVGMPFFWAYSVVYGATGDDFMWHMVRDIARGNNFGDIGQTSTGIPDLQIETSCSSVYGLLGFLELYGRTDKLAYLEMAKRIADNVLLNQFHEGFFVPSKKHIYTRFDCFEPLALLHLDAAMRHKPESVPCVWPSVPVFVPPYRHKREQGGVDRILIYTLTGSSEPPLSLQEAAIIGDVNLVKTLIENGTDVDSLDDAFLKTALHQAVMKGHREVAELLLIQGAQVNQGDRGCRMPLHYAAERGHKEIVELLIAEEAVVNARDNSGHTPIDIAMRGGHSEIAEFLQARAAEISIHGAASQGDMATIKYLLENGTDVNARDENSRTPLIRAVMARHIDVVKFLIEAGADVNLSDKTGFMPLTYALLNKDSDMVRMLLDKAADVNVKANWSGYTSLHWAVMIGSKELTELMLDAGADVNAKSNAGETSLDIAACGDSVAIGELLVAKGAEVTSLHTAAYVGDQIKVEALVAEGVEIDRNSGMFGNTALHSAAAGGHKEVAEFLIDKGSDVNARNRSGQIPLHIAARAGYLDVVQLLLDRGSEVGVQDKNGRTALSLAQKADHTEIVELLRKQGAENLQKANTAENERFNDVADLVLTGETPGPQQFGNRIFQGDVNGDGCDDLLVTASNYDRNKGKAYLYYGGPDMDANADKIFTGENAGNLFGEDTGDLFGEFAFLGELNNDKYDDVIVGALCYNSRQGRVCIFYGGPDMDEDADLILEGEMTDINFGQRITVGDINNDGYKDLFVSAPRYHSYTGRVYLYYGGKTFDTSIDKTFVGEDTDDTFGFQLSVRGDVDGDGFNDLLTGTPFWPNNTCRGRAYLFYGAAGTEMDVTPDLIFDAESGRDNFAVGIDLFDIDNDGYADVLISARQWGEGANASQGQAYIYWGSRRDTMDNMADVTFTGEALTNAGFGGNTIYAGHVNDDPYGDIIIGAYSWYQGSGIGRAYLFYGGTKTSIDTECDHIFDENKQPGTSYGKRALLCDLNNDGLDDIVLGGPTYNNSQGQVWIYFNKPPSSE